jgi:putative membrane protein
VTMSWDEVHPAFNASLNGIAFVFLVRGFRAIRRRDVPRHRMAMLGALSASALFLVSYVIRFLSSGVHRYPGEGWDKAVYLVVLGSHTVLAVVALPLVLRAAFLALTSRFPAHRRVARLTWPIWTYVSVTGVLVYLMLYHLAPRLH